MFTIEKLQGMVFQGNNRITHRFRCDICRDFLSFPPIFHNDVFGNVCGREFCVELAKTKGVNHRQQAYETIAKHLSFPCKYKIDGCKELPNWEDAECHEKSCNFVFSFCPFSSKWKTRSNERCTWIGKLSAFQEHLENHHETQKFENYLELDLEKWMEQNQLYFSNIQNHLLVILLAKEAQSVRLKVWSALDIWRNVWYKIRISTKKGQHRDTQKMQTTHLIHPTFSKQEVNTTWFTVDLGCLKKIFDAPKSLIIEFYFDGFLIGISEKLRSNILKPFPMEKCDNCYEDLVAPHFVCEDMHKICNRCNTVSHRGVNLCRSCNKQLFEKAISVINRLNVFIDHSLPTCSLCKQKVDHFPTHIFNNHKEFILQLDSCYNITCNTFSSFFFFFDENFFLLLLNYNENNISFSVQCLESSKIEYKFDLNFLDSKIAHASMIFSHYCPTEPIFSIKFPKVKFLTSVPVKWLKEFVPFNRNVNFKLNISKI